MLSDNHQKLLMEALSNPAISGDLRSDASVRIALFDSLKMSSREHDGRKLLEPVLTSRLPAADPLEKIVSVNRYQQTYRPGEEIGCVGNQATIGRHFRE